VEQIEALAAQGLSEQQLCDAIGISTATLGRHKKKYAELRQAIERGRAKGIAKVTNALFQNAVSGNLGAQCFFLRNRAGWVDKQITEITGDGGGPVEVVIKPGHAGSPQAFPPSVRERQAVVLRCCTP
jgi:hypothetical protein